MLHTMVRLQDGGVSTKGQAIQCVRGDLVTLSHHFLLEVLPCSALR